MAQLYEAKLSSLEKLKWECDCGRPAKVTTLVRCNTCHKKGILKYLGTCCRQKHLIKEHSNDLDCVSPLVTKVIDL